MKAVIQRVKKAAVIIDNKQYSQIKNGLLVLLAIHKEDTEELITKMAEKMGTRQQTISEWEIGMYEPRGASNTLLTIIAESSNFKYKAE